MAYATGTTSVTLTQFDKSLVDIWDNIPQADVSHLVSSLYPPLPRLYQRKWRADSILTLVIELLHHPRLRLCYHGFCQCICSDITLIK